MAKTKKEKKDSTTIEDIQLIDKQHEEDAIAPQFSVSTDVLMPELEELVKKNPNRLIGCGG
ncbi:MAG: hypothetical protein IT271_08890 [Chitinophagales bacterium]|nr:hypothetical protein [Chitinophagales bacterium]